MPVWLRKTTFNLIKDYYEKEEEEYKKSNNTLTNSSKDISRPNIPNPTYTTKAPKK
jgi:hypothetical protein